MFVEQRTLEQEQKQRNRDGDETTNTSNNGYPIIAFQTRFWFSVVRIDHIMLNPSNFIYIHSHTADGRGSNDNFI